MEDDYLRCRCGWYCHYQAADTPWGFKTSLCAAGPVPCTEAGTISIPPAEIAAITNRNRESGSLADVIQGADVFIHISPGTVTPAMVKTLAKDPILSMANPAQRSCQREALAQVLPSWEPAIMISNQINDVWPCRHLPSCLQHPCPATSTMKLAATYGRSSCLLQNFQATFLFQPPIPGWAQQWLRLWQSRRKNRRASPHIISEFFHALHFREVMFLALSDTSNCIKGRRRGQVSLLEHLGIHTWRI